MSDYMGETDDLRPLLTMADYNAMSYDDRHALNAWIEEQNLVEKRIIVIESVDELDQPEGPDDCYTHTITVHLGGPHSGVVRETIYVTSAPPLPARP